MRPSPALFCFVTSDLTRPRLSAFKWGAHSQLQLSAEEVLRLADMVGFAVDPASRRSIDAVYAHQPGSLLKFTYGACPLVLAPSPCALTQRVSATSHPVLDRQKARLR